MAYMQLSAWLLLLSASYQLVDGRPDFNRGKRHFCGSELADMLLMVCGSDGIFGSSGKRITTNPMADYRLQDQANDLADYLTSEEAAAGDPAVLQARREVEDLRASGPTVLGTNILSELSGADTPQFAGYGLPIDSDRFSDEGRQRQQQEDLQPVATLPRRKRAPGIVDECCYNSCSLDVLRMYCN